MRFWWVEDLVLFLLFGHLFPQLMTVSVAAPPFLVTVDLLSRWGGCLTAALSAGVVAMPTTGKKRDDTENEHQLTWYH